MICMLRTAFFWCVTLCGRWISISGHFEGGNVFIFKGMEASCGKCQLLKVKALLWDMLHYPLRSVATQKNWINTNAVQTSYLLISTVNFSIQCETYGSARRNTHCCFARQTANRRDSLHIHCRRPDVYSKCSSRTSLSLCIPPFPPRRNSP
jgi:hypothetical protein